MKPALFLTAALSTLMLTACGQSKSEPQSFNLGSIESGLTTGSFTNSAGQPTTREQSAEELALAAEQLAQSANFAYAARLADEALRVDSKNVRARFWKAVAGPMMELKGFATRLEPIAMKTPERAQIYKAAIVDLKAATTVKSVSDFIFQGPKDIQSEDEIQDTLSRVTLKMDELRKTVKSMKREELVIYRSPDSANDQDFAGDIRGCTAHESASNVVTLENCDLSGTRQVRLNAADFEVIQQGVAAFQVYIGLINSYSLHGALDTFEKTKDQKIDMGIELLKDARFGTLRDSRTFAVLPELASDAVLAARAALKLQKQACASKAGNWSRRGHLISEIGCEQPDDSVEAALQVLSMMKNGPVQLHVDNGAQTKTVSVDVVGFSKAPLKDLRSLRPTQFDSCGNVTQITDPTVGGLFPNADFTTILPVESCR